MTQYLLALYRDYAVPVPPQRSRQMWARLAAVAEQRPIEVRPLFDGALDEAIEASTASAR
jgi:hypothetical protein